MIDGIGNVEIFIGIHGNIAWPPVCYPSRSRHVGQGNQSLGLTRLGIQSSDGLIVHIGQIQCLTNGQPKVKYDRFVTYISPEGFIQNGRPGCNSTDNSSCTCASNRACIELQKYEEAPFFMRQAMRDFGLADPSMQGIH
jgi:hypothetical protein